MVAVTSRPGKLSPVALVAIAVMVFLGLVWFANGLQLVWTVDANGISIGGETVPERDFTNLWGGGKLALDGRVGVIFDVETYRATMRQWLSPAIANQEWSYPPSFLILGLPLATLPLATAFLVWTLSTLALLLVMQRLAGINWAVAALALTGPGVLVSVLHGQNGALTAALLISGLLFLDRRPVFAGICLGLLTIKPQLGLILPVILVAGSHWKVIATAMVTALALILVTAIAFGPEVWTGFLTVTRPLMVGILEAPFPTGYQMNATTLFLSARALGASTALAYAIQGIALVGCVFAVWTLWRERAGDPVLRVAATIPFVFISSPYGYSYDMAALSVSVALLVWRTRPSLWWGIAALAWIWPALVNPLNSGFFPVSPLILIAFAVYASVEYRRSSAAPENLTLQAG